MTVVVAVTLPEEKTAERWIHWLKAGHVAEVLRGGATSADISRVDGDSITFEVCYRFPSREAFASYERDHAPRLREEGLQLFPPTSGVIYRRTTAAVIAAFSESP